jgi:O-antigen ligase
VLLGVVTGIEALGWPGGGQVPAVGRLVGNSELLAIHLTLLLPIALGLAVAPVRGGRWLRVSAWAGGLLGAAALAVSFSRSGWVGGWAGMSVAVLLAWWRWRRPAAVAVLLLLLAGALLATAILAGWLPLPGVPEAYVGRLRSLGGDQLFGDRAREWQTGLDAIRHRLIFGHPAASNCYNLLLQLAARSGLLILLPFSMLLGCAFSRQFRALRASRGDPLAAGLAGALVGMLVTGVGESSLGLRVMPVAMTVIGLSVALASVAREASKAPPPDAR